MKVVSKSVLLLVKVGAAVKAAEFAASTDADSQTG